MIAGYLLSFVLVGLRADLPFQPLAFFVLWIVGAFLSASNRKALWFRASGSEAPATTS